MAETTNGHHPEQTEGPSYETPKNTDIPPAQDEQGSSVHGAVNGVDAGKGILAMPQAVLVRVCRFLAVKEIVRFSKVCNRFKEAALDQDVWKTKFVAQFGARVANARQNELPNWKTLYKQYKYRYVYLSKQGRSKKNLDLKTLGKVLPVWVDDATAVECVACKIRFSFTKRRHHCRCCGKIFCADCSRHSMRLPRLGYDEPVRVCNTCHNNFTFTGKEESIIRVKVVAFGGPKAGKTSLISRFINNQPPREYFPTEGATFHTRKVKTASGRTVLLEIWDTGGQERYWTMANLYYKDADVVLLCYDPTDRRAIEYPEMWVERISSEAPEQNVMFVLTGLKADLPSSTYKIKQTQLDEFGDKYRIPIAIHTSAQDNVKVDKLFMEIAELVEESS